MALLDTLRKATAGGDVDVLREGVRILAQAIMEAEVSELTGLPHGERDPERRLTHRNGYRDRRWDTRVGTISLAIPRVRDGSYFPSLLDPRRRAERALLAVVQEAYVLGVSTRRVDDLVRALGLDGISKSEVSRMCAALDAEVEAFRGRSLADQAYPYLWLDATYIKVREAGRVVSMAALVASGVAVSGERRILGLELSPGLDEGSAWPGFVRSLVERGLHGVRLVISDDHRGLVKAVREELLGAAWQRCRVHFTRNAQDLVPRSARSMVASAIRSVFEQPDEASARQQLGRVVDGLRPRFPAVADLLTDAEPDLLTHFTFPETHRRQIRSTNPQERLNKEIKRRTAVVGIFPNRAALIRLVGMVLAEQDDEWQDGRRYFRPETMALIDAVVDREEVGTALLMAS
jgi:transposase-like protein